MCNRYRASSIAMIRDVFGFTYIESGPPLEGRYRTTGIGPLQPGPFVRRREIVVGQWGLTPDRSPTLRPVNQQTKRPMSTNNARWNAERGHPAARSFRGPWDRGQRCLVPADDFDEPYWGHGGPKCIWWRMRRADGAPAMLAGLWNDWTDPGTGEVLASYTMLTINCNAHPVLSQLHRPDLGPDGQPLPADQQDKRTVVPLERRAWDAWLHGTPAQAASVISLPAPDLYLHDAVDAEPHAALPGPAAREPQLF